MSLRDRFLNLSMHDRAQTVNLPLITTPPEDNDMALSELKGDPEPSLQTNNSCAPDAAHVTPQHDASLCRIYRYTPVPTVVVDANLSIVEVSDSHLALSGQTRDILLNTCICDIAPSIVPVPDIPSLYGAIRAAISTKQIQLIDDIHLSDKKSYFRLQVTPIFQDRTLIYIVFEAHKDTRDRSDSQDHQHAYVNETYKILVDTVKDYAIFMLDTSGNITTWNSGAAIMKGYSASEIIGKHFSVFYSPEDRRNNKPGRGLAICLRDGRMEDEGWRYRQDGSRFWANVMITPVYEFGRHVGFVKVTRDLTERKAAEGRLIAAFEESSRLKTDFLANMSHEIRTPMNGMRLALSMLTDTELDNNQREYASIIEDSTSVLLQIINDILDYSKLSSGSFSLTSDIVEVESVVGAVVRNCKSCLKPGVTLSCSMPPNFPQAMRGDPLRYRQVLQNLVGNAVKFTEKGHVKISTSFAIDTEDPRMYNISTEVVDSGVGVPGNAINTLFTPFTRFADSTRRKYQGTGLGLSICKSLAELMNGSVGYRPNPDGPGSVFWFTAKMGRTDAQVSIRRSSMLPTDSSENLIKKLREVAPRKHILLVEDNLVNHMVMLKLLQSFGFERVDAAWDGAEAVRLVKQTPLSYNVVLMDISMPVLDGLEATSQIRSMKVDVPIIALTGNALKGDAETYLAKGMNDYLGKPVHRNHLLQVLWKWLGT
ncbi:hypothetical protein BDV33DRAFT_54215 [Aspergillus novoparasiticus]|uniref:histidine kinase n=1 Tax=Aspergillus novoparasiticus TaxID=986946 RepID=A0A5N6F922_9EURO|nr:hypothetical protein BDV33DRAFT_54215 [Aspergillus novoparasiticus]